MPRASAAAAVVSCALLLLLASHRSGQPQYFGRYSAEYLVVLLGGLVLAGGAAINAVARARGFRLGLSRLAGAGVAVFTLVLCLGTVELLLRTVDLFGASLYQEISRYMRELEPDPRLIYRHRPGMHGTFQGVDVSINEMGLRDRPIGPKSPDRTRLLLLGDSVTFGWGVPVEDTFARRLEEDALRATGRPLETINSGVCGYDTYQELTFLQTRGEALSPDAVVLTYVDNDIDLHPQSMEEMEQRWYAPPGSISALLRVSWLYRVGFHILPSLVRRPAVDRGEPGWRNSMASLHDIAAWCRARRVPLAVFFFRLTPSPLTDALDADIRRIAVEERFPYADMLPWFRDVNIRRITNSLIDIHPDAAGHAFIAEGMMRSLVAQHVLGREPATDEIRHVAR